MTVASAIPIPAPAAPVKCALTGPEAGEEGNVEVQIPPLQVPDKVPVMVG